MVSVAAILLMACEPEAELIRSFLIKKGEHYATTRVVESLQSNVLSFKARFDESAIYHFDEQGFQDCKNKLLGFSDCNSMHHENSARFAWQWYNDQLEVWAYCYVNSERVEQFVGVVDINELNNYEISLTSNEYVFRLNGKEPVRISRGNVCDKGVYYMLWPYFGGTLPAPHDVHIDIKILY